MAVLSYDQARAFYDGFGSKQDRQAFYEDPATDELIAHAAFDTAQSVFEFGCGTGRFAEKLLAGHLPATARYVGVDLSTTMACLARERLARFDDRISIHVTDGSPAIDPGIAPDGAVKRFVSNYVLDLLSEEDIALLVGEAYRMLVEGGLLCSCGLTQGRTLASRSVSRAWRLVHSLFPRAVGGCRPVKVREFLRDSRWRVIHDKVVTAYCIPSAVVIAEKRQPGESGSIGLKR